MIGTFFWLTLTTFKNRFLYRLRRMKEIRYLLGAIIGGGYFIFVFTRGTMPGKGFDLLSLDAGALFVLALLILMWILPNLAQVSFSEPELHFILGGPISRRKVMFYKLISVQIPVLIGTMIATAIRFPTGYIVGFWVSYTALGIYSLLVAIAKKKLSELGLPAWWVTLASFLAFIGSTWMVFTFARRSGPHSFAFDSPILAPLLFVPRLFARPLFAKGIAELAVSCLILIAIAVVLFLLASSIRVQFDELVMTASERIAQYRARMQRQPGADVSFKTVRAPFKLPANARPEVAILWKNSIAVVRMAMSGIVLMLIFAALFLAGVIVWEFDEMRVTCAIFAIVQAVLFPIFGSMMFKQDYRLDVTRVDVLKTWPIAGERLIAAEIAVPLATMSILQLILVVNAAVCSSIAMGKVALAASPQVIVMALLYSIPICAVQLVLRNTAAVVFPGWGFRSREEQRGFIAFGQRILGLIVNVLALSLFLAPAAAVGAVAVWIAMQFSGGPAVMAALTMPAVFVLCLEIWFAVKLLGAQYDKLDVAQDLEPAAV